MADLVGVSAGVLTLVGTTAEVIQSVNELAREFHHAPTDITSLARSLQSLMDVLDSVGHDNTGLIADYDRKHSPSFQALTTIGA